MRAIDRIATALVLAMAGGAAWLCFLPQYWSDDGTVIISCGLGSDMTVGSHGCPPPPPGATSTGYGYVVRHAVQPSAAGIVALIAAAVLCLLAARLISRERYILTIAAALLAVILALAMDGMGEELNPVPGTFALGSAVLVGFLVAGLLVCVLSVLLAARKPAHGNA